MKRCLFGNLLFPGLLLALPADVSQENLFSSYALVREADLLAKSGEQEEARLKYEEARHRLQRIEAESPNWEPTVVRHQLQYLAEKLGKQKTSDETSAPQKRLMQNPSFASDKEPVSSPGMRILEIEYSSKREEFSLNEDKIRQNMLSKKGEQYSTIVVDQDIRTLYGTGDYEHVQILASDMRSEDGETGVGLLVVVDPKPVLSEVVIRRMSTDGKVEGQPTLAGKELPLDQIVVGSLVGGEGLHRQVVEWESLYRSQGFPDVCIVPLVDSQKNGRAKVIFEIYEGPRRLIRKISFLGNDHVPDQEIEKVTRLQPRKPWAATDVSDSFDPVHVDEDAERIRDLYRNRGFLDVQITHNLEEVPGGLKINYKIDEGGRYGVGKIILEGHEFFKENEILKELRENSRNKEIFDQHSLKMIKVDGLLRARAYSPQGMQASVQTLQDYYGRHGFREARVSARFLEGEESKQSLRVYFKIEEGERYYVDKVVIRGNHKIPDSEIRSKILLAPGDIFDVSKENKSKEELLATHYYQEVKTFSEESEQPNRQVLVFEVVEKPQELSFGLGMAYLWNGGPERGFVLAAPFPFIISFNFSAGWGMAWMQVKKIFLDSAAKIFKRTQGKDSRQPNSATSQATQSSFLSTGCQSVRFI